jgi:lipopolysaccharide export system permease protein
LNLIPAIDRYIARLIFLPMVGTLILSAMLLVLEKMLRLFDFVASEGGPVSVVWRMLANLIPEYLSLGIPIGLMLGILLAFRRLATSSELDVLRGVGMSFGRLMRVPYAFAFALAAVNLAIVGYVQPLARYAYEGLRFELRSGALGASIKVGEFTNLGERLTLRIESSSNEGRDLAGIFVRGTNADGQMVSATAARGQFLATDDPDTIILRLTRGTLVHESPRFSSPRVLTFDNHDLPIPLPKIEAFRTRGGADRERTIPELLRIGNDGAETLSTRLESRANFHFRLAEVASMFLIPLLALALAIPPKRSTSALGVFLSIVILVTQHKINEYAEALGARGVVDPFIALWVPFALFAALSIWMYYTLAHVPGGQPIGALERFAGRIGGLLRKLVPLFNRRKLAR